VILGWINRIDSATLSAAEVGTLPASNVKHPHLTRKWHTPAGTVSVALMADLGTPLSCSCVALLGTNLTPTATLRVRGSDSDSTGQAGEKTDTGVVLAGVKAGYGAAYRVFTAASARYWRLDIADLSLPSNIQIGRIFLGPTWMPTINISLDWRVTARDDSSRSESYGRQTYADTRPQRRVLEFVLDFQSETEIYSNAFAAARANGIVRDILAIPDIASQYLSEQAVWGLVQASEPISEPRLGLFRQRYTIVERL
jgi:hypothetical protein